MQAIQVDQAGGPEVLRYREVPTPNPGPGMVRVKVHAAGVNHREIWVRQGTVGGASYPYIPGSDAAGEIDALGDGVDGSLEAGLRVVINPGVFCGKCAACLAGDHPACAAYRLVEGTYAEHVIVPQSNVVPMPTGLTFAEAASIGVPFVTAEAAWQAAGVLPGQTVVVFGASGGLGTAAVQLGKLRGARVIAVTRRSTKVEALRKLHSDEVVVWDPARPLEGEIKDLTAGRGADVVLDSLGKASFGLSLTMVHRGGLVITVGATTGGQVDVNLAEIFRRRISVIGAFMGSAAILPRILPLFARGQLMPVIDHVYPLEQADQAHEQLERGDVVGKVVLEV